MNWDDLRILLAVSRAETMTRAARRLGVNQTTVSRRIQALEEALGVELVVRSRDGIALTEAGRQAAHAVEGMELVAHDVERSLIGGDAQLAGVLRVTTIDLIAHYHPDLFASFAAEYPAVELEVTVGFDQRSLAKREADLAIRWTHRPSEGLFGRKLGSVGNVGRAGSAVRSVSRAAKERGNGRHGARSERGFLDP